MMNRAEGAFYLMLARMANGLAAFVSVIVLSRMLDKSSFGLYQQVWLVYWSVLPFFSMALPSSLTYLVPQTAGHGQSRLVLQTVLVLAIGGVGIGMVNCLGAPWLAAGMGGAEQIALFRAFMFYPVFSLPLLCADVWLIALGRPRKAALFSLLTDGLFFASTLIPVAWGLSLEAVFSSQSVIAGLRFVLFLLVLRRVYGGLGGRFERDLLRRQLAYAIPLGLASVVGSLVLQFDRWVVVYFYDPETYASYINGARELPFVSILPSSIMAVVTAEFVRLYGSGQYLQMIGLWHKAMKTVAVLFFPLASYLAVFAADVVVVLFSQKYADSATVFRLYALLLPLRITVFGSCLVAAGRSRLVLRAALATLALDVVLNVLLTPWLGLIGTVSATLVSAYALVGIQVLLTSRLLGTSLGRMIPWRELGRLLLWAGAAGVIAGLVASRLPTPVLRLAAGAVCFGLVGLLQLRCNRTLQDAARQGWAISRRVIAVRSLAGSFRTQEPAHG